MKLLSNLVVMLRKPICIVGAARSGTTFLSHLLNKHSDTILFNEPKYLWRYRKPGAPHDRRTAEEATPQVRKHIRSQLRQHVREGDGARLLEKTPSNCFRIPFVYAVLPDARFIHIIRDGRDVAFSAREQWKLINGRREDGNAGGKERRLVQSAWDRVRSGNVPVIDLPFYAVRFAKTMLRTAGVGIADAEMSVWGPKFRGIQEVTRTHALLETCAIQWRESVRSAREGLRTVPDKQCFEIRFERLVRSPTDTLKQVFEFTELPRCEAVLEHAQAKVNPDAVCRWQGRDSDEVARVMEEVGDFVQELADIG